MDKPNEFSFGDDSVAKTYDTVLVPALFKPWTLQLIDEFQPWSGKKVLDLACGTGVVTKELASCVGSNGRVYALDISSQMLDLAKSNCLEWSHNVEFIVGSADQLEYPDNFLDTIVCQQGFQFFPDKKSAANEIYRVLKPAGEAIISTWCPVSECEYFGAIYETLLSMNQHETAQLIRVPFDFMSPDALREAFMDSGNANIQIKKQERKLFVGKNIDTAIEFAYATPIGPKLKAFSIDNKNEFKEILSKKIRILLKSDGSMGRMVSNVLILKK